MYLDLISGINPFEIFLLFTAGGFLIGYMVGYLWVQQDRRKVMNSLGLNVAKNPRPNRYITRPKVQGSLAVGPIKFHSMPVGHQPWEQSREYAKGA